MQSQAASSPQIIYIPAPGGSAPAYMQNVPTVRATYVSPGAQNAPTQQPFNTQQEVVEEVSGRGGIFKKRFKS